jgi:integrase
MAYIRKLSSGRYQVAWRENVRDEFGAPIPNRFVARSETVDDEKSANRRKMAIEAKIEAGIHPSAQRDKAAAPLAEYARRYFEAAGPTMTQRTLNGYIALYRVHIVDVFGSRPIGSILPSDVARRYSTLLAATPHRRKSARNPKTAKQALGVLRRICNVAVLDSAITARRDQVNVSAQAIRRTRRRCA